MATHSIPICPIDEHFERRCCQQCAFACRSMPKIYAKRLIWNPAYFVIATCQGAVASLAALTNSAAWQETDWVRMQWLALFLIHGRIHAFLRGSRDTAAD